MLAPPAELNQLVNEAVLPAPSHSTVLFSAGELTTGGSTSWMVNVADLVELFLQISEAVKATGCDTRHPLLMAAGPLFWTVNVLQSSAMLEKPACANQVVYCVLEVELQSTVTSWGLVLNTGAVLSITVNEAVAETLLAQSSAIEKITTEVALQPAGGPAAWLLLERINTVAQLSEETAFPWVLSQFFHKAKVPPPQVVVTF